jgi:phospholipid transport system substrate-binding protein
MRKLLRIPTDAPTGAPTAVAATRPGAPGRGRPVPRPLGRAPRWFAGILLAALALVPASVQPAAAAAPAAKVKKPIQTFVNAVRYEKNDLALKFVDGEAQGTLLLGEDWARGTAAQRTEFIKLFHVIFSQLAFPKLKDNLQKIETILYGAPEERDGYVEITSTLVVLHPMKKQEVKVRYRLSETKGAYRLVDVTFEGDESLLTHIRDEQIRPLLADGGWNGLLGQLRARVAEIEARRQG